MVDENLHLWYNLFWPVLVPVRVYFELGARLPLRVDVDVLPRVLRRLDDRHADHKVVRLTRSWNKDSFDKFEVLFVS